MTVSTKPWFVYVVQCRDKTLYTGISTDPHRRLRQHNGEIAGGAGYTRRRKRRPSHLLCFAQVADASAAASCERAIKKLTRAKKIEYVQKMQAMMRALYQPNCTISDLIL